MAKLAKEERDAIRDAAVEQWWKDWFKWDYSWDGLAKKPWQGWVVVMDWAVYETYLKEHGLPSGVPNESCRVVPADQVELLPDGTNKRHANLQDYWRDQEDILVKCNGQKTYTNIHLPLKYSDGTRTWKDGPDHEKWQALIDLLTKRLERGIRTEVEVYLFGDESVKGQDGRAQFCGGVLPAIPSRLEPDQTHQNEVTGLNLTLARAVITTSQNFIGTIFGSAFNGRDAQFAGGRVSFRGAQFMSAGASFDRSQFTGGQVSFDEAQFTGGYASFHQAQFTGGRASFNGAQFTGGDASFGMAQFTGGDASFGMAQFTGGYASFGGARFTGGNAFFNKAQFTGGYVSFDGARFTGGVATFYRAQFTGGDASFYQAQFTGGEAFFGQARFKISCDFKNVLFEGQAKFVDTVFPPAKGSESAFRGTQFLGVVDFSRDNIEQARDEEGKVLPPSQTLFPFNAFENANIKDQLILSGLGDGDAQKEFDLALASTDAACKEDGQNEKITNKKKKKESRYVALERGCTTLKNAMEKTSDKNRAQRYFKFELLARQRRPSTPWVVRKMTSLYGLVADYGGSITRPLLSLLASWAIFAFIYGVNAHLIGVKFDNSWTSLWGPMDFSLTHIFRPLFVWSSSSSANEIGWLPLYKEALSGGGWLTIKVLATLQSLASITLLFLFGLATKRKFQIS